MCCFSRPVQSVSATNIFARGSAGGRQFVVYSMTLKAAENLAMILPLPVPASTAEDAVKFINLEKYADFFSDLHRGFPEPPAANVRSHGLSLGIGAAKPALAVVEVGSFEASFVPTIDDFSRLDERFRLPADVWNALPQYKSFGFAVFKLKSGEKRIHPMAFEFPRANRKQLFFPTVHIHDGKVHDKADFDHALYCQENEHETLGLLHGWRESPKLAREFVDTDKTKGIVDPDRHCHLLRLRGDLINQDTLV